MSVRGPLLLVIGVLLAGCQLGTGDTDPTETAPAPEAETEDREPAAPVSATEQKLVQLEAVDFYATQSLALRIAKQCERLNFDLRRNADLVALRGDGGFRLGARRAVRSRVQALEAAFAEKHGVDLASDDLCAAGEAERREGTALAGTLRRAG